MSELINDYLKTTNPTPEELNKRVERVKDLNKYRIVSGVIAGLALIGFYFKPEFLPLNYFIGLVVFAGFITMYGFWKSIFMPIVQDNKKTSPGINKRLKIISLIGLLLFVAMIALIVMSK